MGENPVKSEYIRIDLAMSLGFAAQAFVFTFVCSIIVLSYFNLEYLSWGIILSVIGFILVSISKYLLRWRAKNINFTRFLLFEKTSKIFLIIDFVSMVCYYLTKVTMVYDEQILLIFSQAPIFATLLYVYSYPLSDIFTDFGRALLSFRQFIIDYRREPKDVDFNFLLVGCKKTSEILKAYNFTVPSYQLAAGISISYLQHPKKSENYLVRILNGLENTDEQKNFQEMYSSIKYFLSISKKNKEKGFDELPHLTMDIVMKILGTIIIPLTVALIAIVVPMYISLPV